MTLRERREPRPPSRTEAIAIRVATFVVLTLLIFGLLLGVLSSFDIKDCPVTIHPNGTWTANGWSVAEDGALWCELNPNPQPGQPILLWDYTWKVQQ